MTETESGADDIGGYGEAGKGVCSVGHPRPSRARSGWMCPRCGLRIVPLTSPHCFEGHTRPADFEQWTVWICPSDNEVVLPSDVSQRDVADANAYHPLFRPPRAQPWLDDVRTPDLHLGWDRLPPTPRPLGVLTFPPVDSLGSHSSPSMRHQWPGAPQPPYVPGDSLGVGFIAPPTASPLSSGTSDPNDSLVTVAAPILAGFSLGTVAVIGTSAALSSRPDALPAMATLAGAGVLFLFSIQMLALGALPGLTRGRGIRTAKAWLYEFGLLAFLTGLGLFLWPRTWSAPAIAGLSAVGLAIVCDLILVGVAWCKRNQWGRLRAGS